MSIINGSLDRRTALLEAGNLRENPFVRTEPPDEVIDRIFVGRTQQLRDAAFRVLDRPRNLLVIGGHGLGKTTFIRKLLRELYTTRTIRFLTGYAPLRTDTPQGLQIAALSALAEGALAASAPGSKLNDYALSVRADLARLGTSTSDELRAPDLRFREGLELARQDFKRVVIAIDEVDKRDAAVIQSMLMGSRFFLDLEASFILTGRYLDVFADIRASLLAAFDHRVELQPLTPEECQEVIQRNLEVARLKPESPPTLRPFEEPVVGEMVKRARGLPRPLNLMADAALEEAVREGMESGSQTISVAPRHLESALRNEGNLVFNDVGAEARKLLTRIFQRTGYVSGADLDALAPAGGLPEAVRNLEELSQRDAVLPLEATGGIAFALTPTVDRALVSLEAQRERLRARWTEVTTSTDKAVRGKSLEEFAEAFFTESFKVVERNARTDTEELDLVLERTPATDPRFVETYLLVECKNWRKQPVDQQQVTTLAGKMDLHHRTQAFLLTSGEFTGPARQQAAHAYSARKLEILLLDGREIEQFLSNLKTVGDFLVELHRRQILLRDYPR